MYQLVFEIQFDISIKVWEHEHRLIMQFNINDVYITDSVAIRQETIWVTVQRKTPFTDSVISTVSNTIRDGLNERFTNISNLVVRPKRELLT